MLFVIFQEQPGKGRVYPKLEEFYIDVHDIEVEGVKLPYKHMLCAMPNVRHMSLSLPGCSAVPALYATTDWLRDLRSLRLINCTSLRERDIKVLRVMIEKLEVLGYTRMHEVWLRRLFGEKLVWNAFTAGSS